MEINAFRELVNITENKWYHIADFGVMAGYQLKLAGHNWKTSNQLVDLLIEMKECGFIQIDDSDQEQVKIMDRWYEFKSI